VRIRRTEIGPWSIFGSILAHLVAAGSVGLAAFGSLSNQEARGVTPHGVEAKRDDGTLEISLEPDSRELSDDTVVLAGAVPHVYGGVTVARLDTGAPGRGGEARGPRATNLAAMNDSLSLSPDTKNRLDRDQAQRLRTARVRTTREDRRSTTHPMELSFVATGTGEVAERRPNAERDPSRGSRVSLASPSALGGHEGAKRREVSPDGEKRRASEAGQLRESPGVGLRRAAPGPDHRASARVIHARPSVAEGSPSVPGIWDGRPKDTVDSVQEVERAEPSLIHASVAGGVEGVGRGGAESPLLPPGAGAGSMAGSSLAQPLGAGDSEWFDWNTSDPMLVPYFRGIHAKVDPLWVNAFPRSAMLELKQGTVIFEVTILSDGTAKVAWPPLRPSGIDEFDRNCADALRRASPFPPLPPNLRTAGRTSLRIRAPFVARNPIIP
jgi:TonB family protein